MTLHDLEQVLCCETPWTRGTWTGKFLSLDDTVAGDFKGTDVWRVLAAGSDPSYGDGGAFAAVIQLHDGRWVAWESCCGCTGRDAYGGDANVFFASTLEMAVMLGLTPDNRKYLGVDNWSDYLF